MNTKEHRSNLHNWGFLGRNYVEFTSGLAGGVSQVLVGHPFDTIKVRLQTQNGIYKSAFDCLCKTVRSESISGLYKGVSAPLLGIGFCANGLFRQILTVPGKELSLERLVIAGSLSGGVMAFANCPIELLKVRLQVQDPSKPRLYRNIFDCGIKTFNQFGVSGLYRGFSATLLRDIPSFMAYFGAYESLRRSWRREEDGSIEVSHLLAAGGLAGIAAWIPCYPQDVIKSRMQANSHYTSTLECAKHILRDNGIRGFFKGFGPAMLRAFPANAATFFAYETTRSFLS